MMRVSGGKLLLFAVVGSLATTASAFTAPSRLPQPSRLLAAVVETTTTNVPTTAKEPQETGAMMDLTGIAFSGLKGQALSMGTSFPSAYELKSVIPKDCFEPDTATSLQYLSISVLGTTLCTALGIVASQSEWFAPENPWTWPLWGMYSLVTGTVGMGLWVLAHECGHGAFSKNRALQDGIGYSLHSLFLVPYYSWQRSHAVHHQYTNHMELGETHVPEIKDEAPSYAGRSALLNVFGTTTGLKLWGALQLVLHLIVGWPAYLLIGATGGSARGMTNHFYPYPLTTPQLPNKELFPGKNWKEKVYQSDIGVATVLAAAAAGCFWVGPPTIVALYVMPLLVVNAWLVLYTWLQHTDVDVPHFSDQDHSFARGALHTIDRPYDKLDPWGLIDFLHHKIGTTHVAHHLDSTIPHYKAHRATEALKANFPECYLYEPTPIPEAVWRVARGCTAVEKRGQYWLWSNHDLEEELETNKRV